MKRIITLLIVTAPFLIIAQNQGNIWYFGEQSGLDFNSGSPEVLSDGQTGTDMGANGQEGTACISDGSGNLLFYTGGKTIWNHDHQPMPNGNDLMGGTSSTQSSLIVPLPGSDSIFYVFTSDEFQSYYSTTSLQKGYRYSIVDICLDSGRGDVMPGYKNILLLDSATEKLAACQDASATGYWVMGHKMFSNEFHAWHLTTDGIIGTVISNIGTIHGGTGSAAQGQMKFNTDGTMLALAISNNAPAIVDLFDFNSGFGVVSNLCHIVIDSALDKRTFGVEFSPDGSKLYASGTGGSGGKRLYQFNLLAGGGDCNAIIDSRVTIYESTTNSIMYGMQVALDNKIYIVCNTFEDIGRINEPNLAGLAADFELSSITLTGTNHYTFPSFVAGYKYSNTAIGCWDVQDDIENVSELKVNNFYPNPFTTQTTFTVNEKIQNASMRIFDLQGREMREIIFVGEKVIIRREYLSAGVYFYQIISRENIIEWGTFIIQ